MLWEQASCLSFVVPKMLFLVRGTESRALLSHFPLLSQLERVPMSYGQRGELINYPVSRELNEFLFMLDFLEVSLSNLAQHICSTERIFVIFLSICMKALGHFPTLCVPHIVTYSLLFLYPNMIRHYEF
jgi:hypothetical protein